MRNSSTTQDVHFAGFSRMVSCNFQDFPRPEKSMEKSRTLQKVWKPIASEKPKQL